MLELFDAIWQVALAVMIISLSRDIWKVRQDLDFIINVLMEERKDKRNE